MIRIPRVCIKRGLLFAKGFECCVCKAFSAGGYESSISESDTV